MIWRRVCILGVGLLGGSIGMRLIRDRLAADVVGFGRSDEKLRRSVELGAIHQGYTDLLEAASDSDLVIACTPVQEIADGLLTASASANVDALFTDVGSTKRTIVEQLSSTPIRLRFIGSHPLAGSDRSGVANANPNLLNDKLVLLTPTEPNTREDVSKLESFWRSLGAKTECLSPDDHDRTMSLTSHLPHMVAAILAASTPEELLRFTGSGWKDTTRIAGGEPELWRQILEENQAHVLHALKNFATISDRWIAALEARDFIRVEQLLQAGKTIRDIVGNRHPSG